MRDLSRHSDARLEKLYARLVARVTRRIQFSPVYGIDLRSLAMVEPGLHAAYHAIVGEYRHRQAIKLGHPGLAGVITE